MASGSSLERNHADDWLWSRRLSIDHLPSPALAPAASPSSAMPSALATEFGAGPAATTRTTGASTSAPAHGPGMLTRVQVHDWRVNDTGLWIWSNAAAHSGNGTLAVSAHSVRIGKGVWFGPSIASARGWPWLDRDRFDDWFVHDHGVLALAWPHRGRQPDRRQLGHRQPGHRCQRRPHWRRRLAAAPATSVTAS